MEAIRPLKTRSMTVEDVLGVFVYQHRVSAAHHEADRDAIISFDMTVQQWYDANLDDFVNWPALGRGLNQQFRTQFTKEQWRQVLKPPRQRTLGDVCSLIASQAQVECIESVIVLGKSCLPAGAFLTIRSILARAGVDVSDLAPSSPLAPYLRKCLPVFIPVLARLAPSKLPVIRVERPLYHSCLSLVMVSCLLGIMTLGVTRLVSILVPGWLQVTPLFNFLSATWHVLSALYAVLFIAGHLGMRRAARQPPRHAELEGLRDFRDLCYAIIGG